MNAEPENNGMEIIVTEKRPESGKPPRTFVPGLLMLCSLGVVLALILVLVLSGVYLSAGEEASGVYRPEGYYKRVREMLNEKGLEYRGPTKLDLSEGNTWGHIALNEDSDQAKHIAFYEESNRLRQDLEEYNEGGPGGLLLVSGGKLGVSRWAHNFSLPYPQRVGYGGRMSFQGEDMPTLASESLNLAFVRSDTPPNEIPARDIKILRADQWLAGQGSQTFRAKGFELHHPKGIGRVLALKVDGEKVRLETPESTFSIKVLLNGVPLNRQGQTEAEREALERVRARQKGLPSNEYLLVQGDRLLVKLDGKEMIFRFGKLSGGLITRNWMSNGRDISQVDSGVAREMPYLKDLHGALNSYVGSSEKPERIASTPAVMTLDRVLNRSLQKDLEEFLAVFDTSYSAESNIEKEPACVTVMDALTGEVLALPSYPSAEKLEQLEEIDLARRTGKMSNRQKERLRLNQNLLRAPVGSTTKPMFALAIWDQYPRLRKLRVVEPSVNVSEVATYKLKGPVGTYASRYPGLTREIDSSLFLTKSSNTYTLSLYLLSLAKPESFRIDSQGYARAVDSAKGIDFSDYISGDIMPGSLNRKHAGNEKFASLFDVGLVSNQVAGELEALSPEILHNLFEALKIPEGEVPREFRGVVCEETNLALQTVDSVRGELVALLLGSGTNFWSNTKLAESFARIGTGKRVEMSLVRQEGKDKPAFPALSVDSDALTLVQKGLAGSTSSIGTAKALREAVAEQKQFFAAKGLEFRLLGKTGTSSRRPGRECAAYVCYAEVLPKGSDKPLAALVTSTYLQDRAHVRDRTMGSASGVAVKLTEKMLPKISDWLANHPRVVDYEKKSK